MVRLLASSVVDRGFYSLSGQTKDYKIDMCCFSAKYAALRSKSNDWLDRNHNNVSEWKRHVYPRTVASVRQHYEKKAKRVGLEDSEHHHHLIEN